MHILALREKFEHMSSVSGYDALYHHFTKRAKINSIFCNFKKMYPRGIGRLMSIAAKLPGSSGFYNAQSVEAETRLMYQALTGKYNIVHYTHGEPYLGMGHALKKRMSARMVSTNHQPVSWWQQNEGLFKKYRKLDKVIALSDYDVAYFNSHMPGKAVCIPHGVDTAFFTPRIRNTDQKSFRIIFSGRYLRDMPTLARLINIVSAAQPNILFDIVYFPKAQVHEQYLIDLMHLPCVMWHANVTDQELRSLYQQADCCVIPLEDCTANNAILEAMACGLPVISTALPAIKTYLDDSMSILGRKNNADDLYDALMLLYNNTPIRLQMGNSARQKAIAQFDWEIIADKTFNFFQSIVC